MAKSPASKYSPVPLGFSTVRTISSGTDKLVMLKPITPAAFKLIAKAACVNWMPASQLLFMNMVSILPIEVRPAGFQYMELKSPFMAVNAFPMAEARASTPIFKNWAAVVPVLVMVALLSN